MESHNETSVGEYLHQHPDFVKRWFKENIEQSVMDEWLEADSLHSMPGQGSSVADRNSTTCTLFKDLVEGKRRLSRLQPRKDRSALLRMSETELLMELIRDIANELDVDVLCHKILLNVSMLTKSDRGSLFLVRGPKDKKYLVSKLFDVTEYSSLEQSLHHEGNQIRVPFGVGIAGSVAEKKEAINIKDAYQDDRFNKAVDKKTGYHTKSILCMPILNYEGEVIGVAQIMNKTDGTPEFTQQDEDHFRNYLTFCGIGLTNAELFEMSVQEYKRNQMLLDLTRGICEEQTNMDKLVQRIMLTAGSQLSCQRQNVYLLDSPETQDNCLELTFIKAFELHAENTGNIVSPSLAQLKESRAAAFAREVANSNVILNVPDVSADDKYTKQDLLEKDGLVIKSILSVPIRNQNRDVVGVVQFMNKINGTSQGFKQSDANMVEAFAIFCGLGIYNCQMYENACRLMAKQSVALEVLSYHASASNEDVQQLKEAVVPSGEKYSLYTYDFSDLQLTDHETCLMTVRMFIDMNIPETYRVSHEVLCRFILSVKKNYRPVIYHNWRHAFNVAQTMFTMCTSGNMSQYLNTLEIFSMLVACLCHDLDHRGTNNAFQSKAESPVAQLYSTSTMEHHHFDQCVMILNSEGNNIFMHLSAEEYKEAIRLVESAILSTDLALYFKKRGSFQALVEQGETKWQDRSAKDLLRAMMMTACDVSAICKPWEVQKSVAQLVASEFFEQGDLERQELHQEPVAMMDRKKKDELPKMQVGFIDAICTPIYKMLARIEPGLVPLYEGCRNNRSQWQKMSDENEKDDTEDTSKMSQSDQTKQAKVTPTIRDNVADDKADTKSEDKGKTGCLNKSSTCTML